VGVARCEDAGRAAIDRHLAPHFAWPVRPGVTPVTFEGVRLFGEAPHYSGWCRTTPTDCWIRAGEHRRIPAAIGAKPMQPAFLIEPHCRAEGMTMQRLPASRVDAENLFYRKPCGVCPC
jgi:hypothetical protein